MTSILIRQASASDLPAIMQVEQSWPEDARAGIDKFVSRLEKFPQGVLIGSVHDESTGAETVVATITAMPLVYSPTELGDFKTWDQVTNNGYLHDVDLATCNALYIVSGVIDSRYRGANMFAQGVLREVELAGSMGLRYVVAGAVIPGYKRYCEQNGDISAFDYCTTRRGRHLVDPLLAMYESIGFSVTSSQHVIPEYYPDDASRNFAALVTRDLKHTPTR